MCWGGEGGSVRAALRLCINSMPLYAVVSKPAVESDRRKTVNKGKKKPKPSANDEAPPSPNGAHPKESDLEGLQLLRTHEVDPQAWDLSPSVWLFSVIYLFLFSYFL